MNFVVPLAIGPTLASGLATRRAAPWTPQLLEVAIGQPFGGQFTGVARLFHTPNLLIFVAIAVIRIEHVFRAAIVGDVGRRHQMDARHEA
jgi:hypothetical protein